MDEHWTSVADPDPKPDPYVFGPPGSFYVAKIVRKTLIPTILWILYYF
jgi:hypothetical protein